MLPAKLPLQAKRLYAQVKDRKSQFGQQQSFKPTFQFARKRTVAH